MKRRLLQLEAVLELLRARILPSRLPDGAGRGASQGPTGGSAPREAWVLARRVERAARFLAPQDACLPKALALHRMLSRRGMASEFCLGVRKEASGRIEAHAWVRMGPDIVTGNLPDLDSFVQMHASLPGERDGLTSP